MVWGDRARRCICIGNSNNGCRFIDNRYYLQFALLMIWLSLTITELFIKYILVSTIIDHCTNLYRNSSIETSYIILLNRSKSSS